MKKVVFMQQHPVVSQISKAECSLTVYDETGSGKIEWWMGWESKKYDKAAVKQIGLLITELKKMKNMMEKHS